MTVHQMKVHLGTLRNIHWLKGHLRSILRLKVYLRTIHQQKVHLRILRSIQQLKVPHTTIQQKRMYIKTHHGRDVPGRQQLKLPQQYSSDSPIILDMIFQRHQINFKSWETRPCFCYAHLHECGELLILLNNIEISKLALSWG